MTHGSETQPDVRRRVRRDTDSIVVYAEPDARSRRLERDVDTLGGRVLDRVRGIVL